MSSARAIASEFSINPISDALGAEIVGLDVSHSLDPNTVQRLRDAFQTYHMLCFRDQHLDDEAMVAFSTQFGPLEAFPEKDKTKARIEVYNVANVSTDGKHLEASDQRVIFQRNNARWHTDSSYRYIPSLASLMYGVEVLPDDAVGGETGFANMLAAYAALPEDMKDRLDCLHQVHSYGEIRRLEPTMQPMTSDERNALPPVTHPVVRVHPDRDYQRSLYFTSNTSLEIGGGTLEEGIALHQWLVDYASREEFCYYHRWRSNDLVMWDNRVLLHRAIEYDYARYRRVLRRTTVAGDTPIMGPFWPEARRAARQQQSP
ncbi:MAG: TauD/TfdA family dioxygenase [Gammaproteobacteria bacterium]|nr:TauD/TfdA family dioxygenase [Gammaproteobacteria bacterium]